MFASFMLAVYCNLRYFALPYATCDSLVLPRAFFFFIATCDIYSYQAMRVVCCDLRDLLLSCLLFAKQLPLAFSAAKSWASL